MKIFQKQKKIVKLRNNFNISGLCFNPLTKTTYPFPINSLLAKKAELFVVMLSTENIKNLKILF